MNNSAPFSDFVRAHLLNSGVVNGAVVVTHHGETVYNHGEMTHLPQADVDQFVSMFSRKSITKPDDTEQPDICIRLQSQGKMVYKVYKKSFTSVYATSRSNKGGLVASNLPYGVLICVYLSPGRAGEAINTIERFCDIMRR